MNNKTHLKFKIIIKIMRFIYLGVKNDNEDYVNNKIKIFNFQNLISIFQLLFSIVIYSIIGNYNSALASFCLIPGVLIGLYFVKIHLYTPAKVFIFIYYNLCVFWGIVYFSHPALNYYYLPVLLALPMNFHYKELKCLIFLIIITMLLFIIGISPLSVYIPKFYADTNPSHSTLAILIILVTYVINLVVTFVMYTNLSHNRLEKMSKRLIKSRRKLILQNNDILSFSSASTRFLRSPIYVLNLFTDKIEKGIEGGKKYDELKEYFDIIQNSLNNEEVFINNMFDYNKIITSSMVFEKFNLRAFLEDELEVYKKLSFKINLEDVMIITDKELLRKILLVIFENAFNYNVSAIPEINIHAIEAPKNISIYFNDNGIGISSDFSDKIFDPFIRVNEIENINGSGLGLAKARKAAEMLNASLSLFKSSERGSIFKLSLKNNYYKEK